MENRLSVIGDQAIMPQTFDGMMKQADVLVKSGLLPAEIKTAAAAVAIMLTGRELSIPPMQAFRSIYVVKGKPTLSAQLMGALIFRAGHSYSVLESTNDHCTIEYKRRTGETYRHAFTIQDAATAGLKEGPTWRQYPKAMLFSRCMSAGARAFMPDVIAGMYTPEEIAGPVPVDPETGEVLVESEAIEGTYREEPEPVAPPPKTASSNGDGAPAEKPAGFPTWSERAKRAFWATMRDLGVSHDAIHAAFGVASMNDCSLTQPQAAEMVRVLKYGLQQCGLPLQGVYDALEVSAIHEWRDGEKAGKERIDTQIAYLQDREDEAEAEGTEGGPGDEQDLPF